LLPKVKGAEGVTLTSVVTKTGLSANHSAEKFGFARAATDAADVLDDDATDIVFIATRHDSHAALAARALGAGKHVFCEKPLALDRESLDEVIAAARDGGTLTVGFNRRFAPLLVKAKEALVPRSGPLMMLYRINAGAIPADSWIQRGEGGGRILGEVCHFVDSLTYLCGAAPIDAQAAAAQGHSDAVTAILRFADGSVGTIIYSSLGDPSLPKEYLEAFGAGRAIALDDFTELTIHAGGKAKTVKATQDKGQAQLVAAFLDSARGKAPTPIPLVELDAVSRATIAIEEALRGQPV
jgi:predicted dehydrogenase